MTGRARRWAANSGQVNMASPATEASVSTAAVRALTLTTLMPVPCAVPR